LNINSSGVLGAPVYNGSHSYLIYASLPTIA